MVGTFRYASSAYREEQDGSYPLYVSLPPGRVMGSAVGIGRPDRSTFFCSNFAAPKHVVLLSTHSHTHNSTFLSSSHRAPRYRHSRQLESDDAKDRIGEFDLSSCNAVRIIKWVVGTACARDKVRERRTSLVCFASMSVCLSAHLAAPLYHSLPPSLRPFPSSFLC